MLDDDGISNVTVLSSDDSLAASVYEKISCFVAWSTLTACFLGIFSNVLSMIIFASPSMRKAPINLLLFGISAVDFFLCILAVFVFVVPEFYGCYRSPFSLFLLSYSVAYIYPLTSSSQTASIWLFLVVSYERWNVVCGKGGQGYRRASSVVGSGVNSSYLVRDRRRAVLAVVVVVFLSLSYNFVRFFEYRVVSEYDGDQGVTLFRADDLLKNPDVNPNYHLYMYLYYVALFLLTHFAGPFFTLVLVNGMILKTIYVARRRRRLLLSNKEEKEHRTSLMMAIIISMFLICHALPFVLNVIESIDSSWFIGDNVVLAYALNDVSNLLIVANAAATALIYYHFNRSYHEMCTSVFLKCCYQMKEEYNIANNDYCEQTGV